MRLLFTIIFTAALVGHELCAQWHITSSEVTGNYSGVLVGMANRAGLRSGWNSIADTVGSEFFELDLLAVVLIPVSGNITESSTLALGLEVPYVSKRLVQTTGQRVANSGIGDARLVGKYGFTIYKEFSFASRRRLLKAKVDFIAKLKLPSGKSRATDIQGIALPHYVQLGTGSTDYAVGFAFLTETEKYWMIHGHAMYWLNTSANGHKEGNNFNYELRFLLVTLNIPAGPLGAFLPSIGVRGMHAAKDEGDGMRMGNSGGDVMALSVGLQSLWGYVEGIGTFLMFDASYQLPFVQRLNGVQAGYGSSLNAGVRVYLK